MIKKSRKQFVPDELKDDKYWARRRKNNIAAKRSRDARRQKENQIAMRARYLEKEVNFALILYFPTVDQIYLLFIFHQLNQSLNYAFFCNSHIKYGNICIFEGGKMHSSRSRKYLKYVNKLMLKKKQMIKLNFPLNFILCLNPSPSRIIFFYYSHFILF